MRKVLFSELMLGMLVSVIVSTTVYGQQSFMQVFPFIYTPLKGPVQSYHYNLYGNIAPGYNPLNIEYGEKKLDMMLDFTSQGYVSRWVSGSVNATLTELFQHNDAGWVTQSYLEKGSKENPNRKYYYFPDGRIQKIEALNPGTGILGYNYIYNYIGNDSLEIAEYDKLVLRKTLFVYDNRLHTVWEYNQDGNVQKQFIYTYNANGLFATMQQVGEDGAESDFIEFNYDTLDVFGNFRICTYYSKQKDVYSASFADVKYYKSATNVPSKLAVKKRTASKKYDLVYGYSKFIKDGLCGVLDSAGIEQVPPVYTSLTPVGVRLLIAGKNGKFGLINVQNKAITPFQYDTIISCLSLPKSDTRYRFLTQISGAAFFIKGYTLGGIDGYGKEYSPIYKKKPSSYASYKQTITIEKSIFYYTVPSGWENTWLNEYRPTNKHSDMRIYLEALKNCTAVSDEIKRSGAKHLTGTMQGDRQIDCYGQEIPDGKIRLTYIISEKEDLGIALKLECPKRQYAEVALDFYYMAQELFQN